MQSENYSTIFVKTRVSVIDAIETSLSITYNQIISKARKREIADARHLYMYFMRQFGFSLHSIGISINRDHSSVVFGIKKVRTLIDIDPLFKDKFVLLESVLKNNLDKRMSDDKLMDKLKEQLINFVFVNKRKQAERILENIVKTELSKYNINTEELYKFNEQEDELLQENEKSKNKKLINVKEVRVNFERVKEILKHDYGWDKIDRYPEAYINNLKQVTLATIKAIKE
jgi:hypothetical protein